MPGKYFKIRSWHILDYTTSRGEYVALCKRSAPPQAPTSDDFGDEKSCETCLRAQERRG